MTDTSTPPAGIINAITVKDSDAPADFNPVFFDAEGNVVAPDDIPVYASNDATVCDIGVVAADGLSGTLKYGIPGSVTITATSHDNDGTVVVATGTVTVTVGEAVTGQINFSVPTEAPPVVAPSDPTAPSTSDGATPDPAAATAGATS